MAFMELKLKQVYAGQEMLMVFGFQSTGTPAAVSLSFALVSAFGAIPDAGVYPSGTLLRALLDSQVNTVACDLVTARDIYSVTDFYETPFVPNLSGALAQEGMTPAMAAGFRSSRVRSDIRRGRKYLGGQAETDWGQGGVISAGAVTRFTAIANALGTPLTYDDEGNTLTFSPIVYGKQEYDPDTGNPATGTGRYRYYPTALEQADHIAIGISYDFYQQLRTMRSRQYGHGR